MYIKNTQHVMEWQSGWYALSYWTRSRGRNAKTSDEWKSREWIQAEEIAPRLDTHRVVKILWRTMTYMVLMCSNYWQKWLEKWTTTVVHDKEMRFNEKTMKCVWFWPVHRCHIV